MGRRAPIYLVEWAWTWAWARNRIPAGEKIAHRRAPWVGNGALCGAVRAGRKLTRGNWNRVPLFPLLSHGRPRQCRRGLPGRLGTPLHANNVDGDACSAVHTNALHVEPEATQEYSVMSVWLDLITRHSNAGVGLPHDRPRRMEREGNGRLPGMFVCMCVCVYIYMCV